MSTVLDVTRGIVCKVASPRCKSEIPPQEAHLEAVNRLPCAQCVPCGLNSKVDGPAERIEGKAINAK